MKIIIRHVDASETQLNVYLFLRSRSVDVLSIMNTTVFEPTTNNLFDKKERLISINFIRRY